MLTFNDPNEGGMGKPPQDNPPCDKNPMDNPPPGQNPHTLNWIVDKTPMVFKNMLIMYINDKLMILIYYIMKISLLFLYNWISYCYWYIILYNEYSSIIFVQLNQ